METTLVRVPDVAGCRDTHDVTLNGVVVGQVYRDRLDKRTIWYGVAYPEADTPARVKPFVVDPKAVAHRDVVQKALGLLPAKERTKVQAGTPPTPPRRLTLADLGLDDETEAGETEEAA